MVGRIHRFAILALLLAGMQACAGGGAEASSDPCVTVTGTAGETPGTTAPSAPQDPCAPPDSPASTAPGSDAVTLGPACPAGEECPVPLPYDDDDLSAIGSLAGQYDRGALVAQMAFAETAESGPDLQLLADRMASLERDQRGRLEVLLTSWGTTVTYSPPAVEAAIDAAALQLLAVVTGVDFDRLWLQVAAGHLLHVADLAGTLATQATGDDLRVTAEQIAADCREIAEEMIARLNA